MKRMLIFAAVMAVLLVGVGFALDQVRARTASLTQAQLYKMATSTPRGSFAGVPGHHDVVVPPPDGGIFRVVLRYAQLSATHSYSEGAGNFDDNTGKIRILSEAARYQARLPEGLRPDFDHTVRHEYGHAFLADFLKGSAPKGKVAKQAAAAAGKQELAFMPFGDDAKPDPTWPAAIQPVVHEFQHQPRDIYGADYYTSTFGEFFAESYARFCEGKDVPRATTAFLTSRLSGRE